MVQHVAACCSLLCCVASTAEEGKAEMQWRVQKQIKRSCCSVLQRVAACCSVLQCVAACCSASTTDEDAVELLQRLQQQNER